MQIAYRISQTPSKIDRTISNNIFKTSWLFIPHIPGFIPIDSAGLFMGNRFITSLGCTEILMDQELRILKSLKCNFRGLVSRIGL
jgi:hypothetical protein